RPRGLLRHRRVPDVHAVAVARGDAGLGTRLVRSDDGRAPGAGCLLRDRDIPAPVLHPLLLAAGRALRRRVPRGLGPHPPAGARRGSGRRDPFSSWWTPMASVALIGPDGAGKTTLTRMLEQSDVLPFRYLYMGIDIPASSLALPTSRLIERLKQRGPAAGGGTAATSRPARKGLL